jgi:serine-type D-Ala-D-Ala carboxypeptidase/endopeptidase (penicillin-binding protein 4)
MKASLTFLLSLLSLLSFSQTVTQKLSDAVKKLEADNSMKHGIVSLYVINNKTGKVIYDKNSQVGLPAGSTQKVITSVTAFELLGKDYRYKTSLFYTGYKENSHLWGSINILGSGDPTLGSSRFSSTNTNVVLNEFTKAIKEFGILNIIEGIRYIDIWKGQSIPDGWIWQDLGNYYGATAKSINWKENQYTLYLKSGHNIGDSVSIIGSTDSWFSEYLLCNVTSAPLGSGDRTNIYLPFDGGSVNISGTIPINQDSFKVSGAYPYSVGIDFVEDLANTLRKNRIQVGKGGLNDSVNNLLFTHFSPSLDSINYFFLQNSINLYGEALLRTISYDFKKNGSTDTGVAVIKEFWSKRGIDKSALNIKDGSGLSPANRITANALVTVLNYAKTKPWFSSFYDALPYVNGFKMKSGTIGDVLAYTGYINDYTFAIIVNNYDGKAKDMRLNMLFLLDNLK